MADAMTNALHATQAFMEPAFRSALKSLALANGSSGLDMGCGIGSIWPVVAREVGVEINLTALDPSEHCFNEAQKVAGSSGLDTPVRLHHLDLERFVAETSAQFDWLWSADVLWPNFFADVPTAVRHCVQLLKPGGTFAFFTANYYRSVFLPGYTRLESLVLLASQRNWGVELAGNPNYYENAPSWLKAAGLEAVTLTLHPAVHSTQALAEHPGLRRYLEEVVFPDYRRAAAQHGEAVGLRSDELELLAGLIDPASKDYLPKQTGYYSYHVGILVSGKKPSEKD